MYRVAVACDVCGETIAAAPTKKKALELAEQADGFFVFRHRLHFCSAVCRFSERGVELRRLNRPAVKAEQEALRRAEWNARQAELLAQAEPSELDSLSPQELARMVPRS